MATAVTSFPLVLVVSAPSGAGKTTLVRKLLEQSTGLRFSVSHTTRPARTGEVDGHDYHFTDRTDFESQVAKGCFLEWAEVYGNLYGTHRSELERADAEGFDLLVDVDVQGARSIRAALASARMVLILPPSWGELQRRLRARGTDTEDVIERRLAQAADQVAGWQLYDYAIVNDGIEAAVSDLAAIVRTCRLSMSYQASRVTRLLAEAIDG